MINFPRHQSTVACVITPDTRKLKGQRRARVYHLRVDSGVHAVREEQ